MTFWPVLYFLSISYFSFTSKVVESSRSRCLNECLYYPAEIISLLSNIIIKFLFLFASQSLSPLMSVVEILILCRLILKSDVLTFSFMGVSWTFSLVSVLAMEIGRLHNWDIFVWIRFAKCLCMGSIFSKFTNLFKSYPPQPPLISIIIHG